MIPASFQIGPLTFHLYGFIIAIAILSAYLFAKKRLPFFKLPANILDGPLLFISLFLSLIFARAYHVLDNFNYYSQNPGQIPAVWNGGIGILGGLIGFFAGVWLFAKTKKLSFLTLGDLLSPSILLAQSIGRIGNYINQEAFGPPTNLPWGVFIKPENRPLQFQSSAFFHPTFFYEAILELLFFLALITFEKKRHVILNLFQDLALKRFFVFDPSDGSSTQNDRKKSNNPGQIFGLYLIFYSLSRSFAELFRIDTAVVGSLKVAYLILIPTFILGLYLFFRNNKGAEH